MDYTPEDYENDKNKELSIFVEKMKKQLTEEQEQIKNILKEEKLSKFERKKLEQKLKNLNKLWVSINNIGGMTLLYLPMYITETKQEFYPDTIKLSVQNLVKSLSDDQKYILESALNKDLKEYFQKKYSYKINNILSSFYESKKLIKKCNFNHSFFFNDVKEKKSYQFEAEKEIEELLIKFKNLLELNLDIINPNLKVPQFELTGVLKRFDDTLAHREIVPEEFWNNDKKFIHIVNNFEQIKKEVLNKQKLIYQKSLINNIINFGMKFKNAEKILKNIEKNIEKELKRINKFLNQFDFEYLENLYKKLGKPGSFKTYETTSSVLEPSSEKNEKTLLEQFRYKNRICESQIINGFAKKKLQKNKNTDENQHENSRRKVL